MEPGDEASIYTSSEFTVSICSNESSSKNRLGQEEV